MGDQAPARQQNPQGERKSDWPHISAMAYTLAQLLRWLLDNEPAIARLSQGGDGARLAQLPLPDGVGLRDALRLAGTAELANPAPPTDIPRYRRPWWEREPEVADFVRGLFGTMPVAAMPKACHDKFSAARSPSRSGVTRYMTHLRGGEFRGAKRPANG